MLLLLFFFLAATRLCILDFLKSNFSACKYLSERLHCSFKSERTSVFFSLRASSSPIDSSHMATSFVCHFCRFVVSGSDSTSFFEWVDRFPAQVVLLSTQIRWSRQVEDSLKALRLEKEGKLLTSGDGSGDDRSTLSAILDDVKQTLNCTFFCIVVFVPSVLVTNAFTNFQDWYSMSETTSLHGRLWL